MKATLLRAGLLVLSIVNVGGFGPWSHVLACDCTSSGGSKCSGDCCSKSGGSCTCWDKVNGKCSS